VIIVIWCKQTHQKQFDADMCANSTFDVGKNWMSNICTLGEGGWCSPHLVHAMWSQAGALWGSPAGVLWGSQAGALWGSQAGALWGSRAGALWESNVGALWGSIAGALWGV